MNRIYVPDDGTATFIRENGANYIIVEDPNVNLLSANTGMVPSVSRVTVIPPSTQLSPQRSTISQLSPARVTSPDRVTVIPPTISGTQLSPARVTSPDRVPRLPSPQRSDIRPLSPILRSPERVSVQSPSRLASGSPVRAPRFDLPDISSERLSPRRSPERSGQLSPRRTLSGSPVRAPNFDLPDISSERLSPRRSPERVSGRLSPRRASPERVPRFDMPNISSGRLSPRRLSPERSERLSPRRTSPERLGRVSPRRASPTRVSRSIGTDVWVTSEPYSESSRGKLEDIFIELSDELDTFGPIRNYELIDKEVAFITFENERDARAAIRALNGKIYNTKFGDDVKIYLDWKD